MCKKLNAISWLFRRPVQFLLYLAVPLLVNAQDLCLGQIGGLSGAPTMDGNPHDDVGWNGAGKLGLREHNGVPMAGAVQYGVNGGFLYLAVDSLTGFDQGGGTRHPGVNDTVVLVLSTDDNPAHDWRIHIKPFIAADAGDNLGSLPPSASSFVGHPPRALEYWRGSTNWNENKLTTCTANETNYANCIGAVAFDAGGLASGGVLTNARFVVSRQEGRWGLEAKLPYHADAGNAAADTGIYIPAAGPFKFYVNIVSTNDLNDTYVEDPWPDTTTLVPSGLKYVQNSTPKPAQWGTVTLDPPKVHTACTGLSVAAAGVRDSDTTGTSLGSNSRTVPPSGFTGNAPFYLAGDGTKLTTAAQCVALPDDFHWTGTQQDPTGTSSPPNWFVAKVANTGADANGVSARFYIAPWGIPGTLDTDWHRIGKLYDPDAVVNGNDIFQTAAPSIPAAGAEIQTKWQLSYKESCAYLLSNQSSIVNGKLAGHHCIHVELESSDASTLFLNKSYQFNHDIAAASTVTRVAEISVRGYGKPPLGSTGQKVFLNVDAVARSYVRDGELYFANNVAKDCLKAGLNGKPNDSPDRTQGRTAAVAPSPLPTTAETCRVDPQFAAFPAIPSEYFPNGLSQGLTWIARGYLLTGDRLIVGDKAYERAKFVGGFSQEAGHFGPVASWGLDFSGPGVTRVNGNDSVLTVPEEGSVTVTATVTAQESNDSTGGFLHGRIWWVLLLIVLVLLFLYWRNR